MFDVEGTEPVVSLCVQARGNCPLVQGIALPACTARSGKILNAATRGGLSRRAKNGMDDVGGVRGSDSEAVAATANTLESRLAVDHATALRFSRARKGDLAKTEAFLAADLKWRADFKPDRVRQADLPNALPSGSWRLVGQSSPDGYPVLLVTLALWNPSDYDVEEYGSYACYFLEAMCRIGERFIVVFDMAGWKLSHALHMRKIKRLVSTLQDHYPERLERALLLRAPGIFAGAWKIIKGFVDPNTAAKVAFIANSREAESQALEEVGALRVVPTCYGGHNEEVVPVPNIPGEPSVAGAPALCT